MSVLSVQNVTKRFGRIAALDTVSFDVQEGRIFGLLGPNGAGKTTAIRLITYITVPDEGRVVFRDREVGTWSQDRMGYLPEERGLYRKMRVGEQLEYLAQLKGLKSAEARHRVTHWLARFELTAWAGRKTNELSKGMQQKVQFIATILHDPDLLIFDEPFSGLDPINADTLKEIILELRAQGKTILFASHRMEQVEQLCDDICLISEGKALLNGPLRDIKRSFGLDTVILGFEGDPRFLSLLDNEPGIRIATRSNSHAELRLNDPEKARLILETALQHVEIHRFELVEPSLNEIFVSVVDASRRAGKPRQEVAR
jgi:ABC-2 type transport system ATP-binding protein